MLRIEDVVNKLLNNKGVKGFSGNRIEQEKFLLSLIFRKRYPLSCTKIPYDFMYRFDYEKYVEQVDMFEDSFKIIQEDSLLEHGVRCFLIEDIQNALGLSNFNLDEFLKDVKSIVGLNVKFIYCSFRWKTLSENIPIVPFAFTPEVLSMYNESSCFFYTMDDFSYKFSDIIYPSKRDCVKPDNLIVFFEGCAQEKLRRLLNLEFAENGNLIIFLKKKDYEMCIDLILSNNRKSIFFIKESSELIMIHIICSQNKNDKIKLKFKTKESDEKEGFVNYVSMKSSLLPRIFFHKKITESWFKDYLARLGQENLLIKKSRKLSFFLWCFYQKRILTVDKENQKIKFNVISLAGYIGCKYKEICSEREGYTWKDLAVILNNGSDLKGNIKKTAQYKEKVAKKYPNKVDIIDSIFENPNITK